MRLPAVHANAGICPLWAETLCPNDWQPFTTGQLIERLVYSEAGDITGGPADTPHCLIGHAPSKLQNIPSCMDFLLRTLSATLNTILRKFAEFTNVSNHITRSTMLVAMSLCRLRSLTSSTCSLRVRSMASNWGSASSCIESRPPCGLPAGGILAGARSTSRASEAGQAFATPDHLPDS
ncbi:hypothetical protein EJ04DRAFT_223509 [Polyplosphaeria fusca]|uniref:Uncharacterized protein n=1 Tax=Polyplosphaeria fusca TaxID=682080 RepID=A0A9P4R1T5_9PLEO|nr:hypothetical protein EJ04DRAFT_223509 [Polyplosphaeria fusca]